MTVKQATTSRSLTYRPRLNMKAKLRPSLRPRLLFQMYNNCFLKEKITYIATVSLPKGSGPVTVASMHSFSTLVYNAQIVF